MPLIITRLIGHRALGGAQKKGWIDVPLGFALLGDRRVPVMTKLAAVVLGGALTFGLQVLEIPLEALVAVLLPVVGVGFDAVVDGIEALVLPFVFGAILLTHFAPKELASLVRLERQAQAP